MMSRDSGKLYMVLELAAAGDLRGHLTYAAKKAAPFAAMPRNAAADGDADGVLVGLARLGLALEYMHHNQVLHRDIKAGRWVFAVDPALAFNA